MASRDVISLAMPELQKDDYFIFQTIMNKMNQGKLTSTSASVECKINIDRLQIPHGSNCFLDFMNSCSADESITELFFKSVSESLWLFSPAQKERLERQLGIKLDSKEWYKTINDKCDVFAKINNKIDIGHLAVESCNGNLVFHNTGSAKATCAISSFFQGFEEEQVKPEVSVSIHVIIGFLACFIVFSIFLMLTTGKTRKKVQRVSVRLK